jgi:signal transduction histidine kinase
MRERAGLVEGRLVIRSQPGKGTKVTLRVPICGRQR